MQILNQLLITSVIIHYYISNHKTYLHWLISLMLIQYFQGFCPPDELSDEQQDGEGATEFEDIEGGGMGEGEGAKDVSDQIENEDQLDEARKEGEEKEDKDPNEMPDIENEENGIEMSEDMDGKMHDMEDGEEG